jgi:cell division septum initiation protein DivIVA
VVDEDRVLEIIDQMRISIPDEVKKSQQVLAQRDRVMAQAQEEANRTLSLAKRRGEESLSRDTIVEAAHERAEQILEQARADADSIHFEADDYTVETLAALEDELTRLLNQTRNGITKISADKQRLVPAEAPPELVREA